MWTDAEQEGSGAPDRRAPLAMTTGVQSPQRARIPQRTLRTDRWWLPPTVVVIALTAWLAYGAVRVYLKDNYWVGEHHYLTPFYSPCTSDACIPEAAHFGQFIPDLAILPYAALSLPFLLLFRLTCYYYRRAYYRAFWQSPPACSVAEPHKKYTGETRFPLIFQNAHRYVFYIAVVITLVNTYDMILAFGGDGYTFGVGLGNLILIANVILLWGYTVSCHSCRHVTGGRLRNFGKHPILYRWWTFVSRLNTRHMQYAWITLASLVVTDFYIMAVSAGWITDVRFFN
ncbi:MAG TPA: hypothetical protein VFZ37_09385 [Jiangellaceae bacterium]